MKENNCYQNYICNNNSSKKILSRYTIAIAIIMVILSLYYLINMDYDSILLLLRCVIFSNIFVNGIQLVFNMIKKDDIYLYKNVFGISLLLSLLIFKENIVLIIISSIITGIFLRFKKFNFSSILFGLLLVEIYKCIFLDLNTPFIYLKDIKNVSFDYLFSNYGNYLDFLLGFKFDCISILLIIGIFFYLFIKKSIKYSIVLSYVGISLVLFFIVGLYSELNIMYVIFIMCFSNMGIFSLFILSDYYATPVSVEGGYIYGLILGIISFGLYYIIPNGAIIVSLLVGVLLISKYIDKISMKLIEDYKLYYRLIIGIFIFGICISNLIGFILK